MVGRILGMLGFIDLLICQWEMLRVLLNRLGFMEYRKKFGYFRLSFLFVVLLKILNLSSNDLIVVVY